jgi:hypothetical protein
VIRPRKKGGEILYAQDYNIDTLLPRFRAVVENEGPITLYSDQYATVGTVTIDPPIIAGFALMYTKARIEINNTHTNDVRLEINYKLSYSNDTTTEEYEMPFIDRAIIPAGASVSADAYGSQVMYPYSVLANRLDVSVTVSVTDANTGALVTTVPVTLRDIIVYVEL